MYVIVDNDHFTYQCIHHYTLREKKVMASKADIVASFIGDAPPGQVLSTISTIYGLLVAES